MIRDGSPGWVLPAIAVAGLHLFALPATAGQDLLDLSVDRDLTEQELEVLSGLLIQSDVGELARLQGPAAPPAVSVCTTDACRISIRDAMAQAAALADQLAANQPAMGLPSDLQGWEGSVFLPAGTFGSLNDQLIANVAPADAPSDFRAIPVGDLSEWLKLGDIDAPAPVLTPRSLPTQLIAADLQRQGQSRRSFAIRSDISAAEQAAAVTALQGSGLIAATRNEESEQPAALITPLDVFSFEGQGDPGSCATDALGKPWPFSHAEVIAILSDNLRIMQQLHLPVRQSTILIADTGIGEKTVQEAAGPLAGMLAPNPAELLNPMAVFENGFGGQGSVGCLDQDGTGYWGDVFGAVGSALNVQLCPGDAENLGFVSRLAPEPRRVGAVETYEPSHGSFVAMLAAGGPALLADYPQIVQQIGLQVFKTTRPSEPGSTKSVRVDPADISGAVRYALSQKSAVLNMSMKTSDSNLRQVFDQGITNGNTLVVTSAGNVAEDLDLPNNRAFPAGLRNDKLIVVGGLTDDGNRSWWSQSARGERHVDIAAPATRVGSIDQDGKPVCFSGTSAAAPLVSFTAGVLLSYGLFDAKRTKARILEAAEPDQATDPEKTLKGRVRHSRKLDVAAALDVFMDRIRLKDAPAPFRGRIITEPALRMVKICNGSDPSMAQSNGMVDPFKLRNWHRAGSDGVYLLSTADDAPTRCALPTASEIPFMKQGESEVTVFRLEDIESMVLSPFRSAAVERAVQTAGAQP